MGDPFRTIYPDISLNVILPFLEASDLSQLAQVSKFHNQLVSSEEVWENKYKNEFGSSVPPQGQTWKQFYKEEYTGLFKPVLTLLRYQIGFCNLFHGKKSAEPQLLMNPPKEILKMLKRMGPRMQRVFKKKQSLLIEKLKVLGHFRWIIVALIGTAMLVTSETIYPEFFDYPYLYQWIQNPLDLIISMWPLFVYLFLFTSFKVYCNVDRVIWKEKVDLSAPQIVLNLSMFKWKLIVGIFRAVVQELLYRYVYVCGLMIILLVANKVVEFFLLVGLACIILFTLYSIPYIRGLPSLFLLITSLVIESSWLLFQWKDDLLMTILRANAYMIHAITMQRYKPLIHGSYESQVLFVNTILLLGFVVYPLTHYNHSTSWMRWERVNCVIVAAVMIHVLLNEGFVAALMIHVLFQILYVCVFFILMKMYVRFKKMKSILPL